MVLGAASTAGAVDAENLRLLGSMTTGVAHDLRNVLHGVSLHAQVLARSGGQDASDSLAHLKTAVTAGVELLDRLVMFGSAHARPRTNVHLDQLAHDACELSRVHVQSANLKARVVLREAHGPSTPVSVHGGDVLSAMVNLIINAVDAMPRGGAVDVTTGSAREGAWVNVSDDGPGIPEALRRRVFERFFTTKGSKGSGLGLSQVLGCAERHGGTVHLEAAGAESRTTFVLWFPASRQAEPTPTTLAGYDSDFMP
jgi:signal transduction histidine kinase